MSQQNSNNEIWFYDRQTGQLIQETIYGGAFINWIYNSRLLPLWSFLLFNCPFVSRVYGKYMDSRWSQRKIRAAITQLKIDESEFLQPTDSFPSFNDFFIRELKPESRPYDDHPDILVCPGDGRVTVYPELHQQQMIPIKGMDYSIDDLLPRYGAHYHNGALAVIRLCPADYHRFHFPCAGTVLEHYEIHGQLHSVNPIALARNINVFCHNYRQVTRLESNRFGVIALIEVGAFGVGRIVQTFNGTKVEKMQEKGYFKFGGSTIVMVFKKQKLNFTEDLLVNTGNGYETLVRVGETIGVADTA